MEQTFARLAGQMKDFSDFQNEMFFMPEEFFEYDGGQLERRHQASRCCSKAIKSLFRKRHRPDFSTFMTFILALKAFIMGIVEGCTEFLPISSTGHLILAGSLLDFTGDTVKVFSIAIQSGAMLSVCWVYRYKIVSVTKGMFTNTRDRKFVINLIVAFLPAAIAGVLFSSRIQAYLFYPIPVAIAFIAGGLLIIFVERRNEKNPVSRVESVDDMSVMDAFKVGCAQAFALIPGTSRSGATIIGGMLFGLSRKAATEFSFFLAIPTLFGAAFYSVIKERALLSASDVPLFTIGSVAAFISAFLCVRWLLHYISSHNFIPFAWYRIGFGIFVLVSAHYGWVAWIE